VLFFVTFTVPEKAKAGPTGMRLQVQEILNNATTINPCELFKYGGTKDFGVTILSPSGERGMETYRVKK